MGGDILTYDSQRGVIHQGYTNDQSHEVTAEHNDGTRSLAPTTTKDPGTGSLAYKYTFDIFVYN